MNVRSWCQFINRSTLAQQNPTQGQGRKPSCHAVSLGQSSPQDSRESLATSVAGHSVLPSPPPIFGRSCRTPAALYEVLCRVSLALPASSSFLLKSAASVPLVTLRREWAAAPSGGGNRKPPHASAHFCFWWLSQVQPSRAGQHANPSSQPAVHVIPTLQTFW